MTAETSRAPGRLSALPRNVWVVTLTSFFTDVSSEMLATLLPLFLNDVLKAGTGVIGLIEGVAETTASVVKLGSGRLSDRLGRRKGLTVAGYALSTLAKPCLYFAQTWGVVLATRFADRFGKGLRTAPRDALVADSTPASQRGLAFGVHRAGDTAGAVVGLLVALGVVWAAERNALVLSASVFRTLVLLSIAPAVLAVLVLALGAREVARPRPTQPTATTHIPIRFSRRFQAFVVVMVVFTLGNSSDAFLILRARAAGLPLTGVLGMTLSFNLVYTIVAGPAGALSDRIGRRRLIVGGWIVYALIYLGFARVSAGWQAWVLMTLYGVYYALTEGAAKAFVADLVPAESRGTAYGVFNAAIGLAALPASVIAGVLWQGIGPWHGLGPAAPFWFGATMAGLATVLLVILVRPPGKDFTRD